VCTAVKGGGRDPELYHACDARPYSVLPKTPPHGGEATVDHIALFHYVTRSREDFAIKNARATPSILAPVKPWAFYDLMDRCALDATPCWALAGGAGCHQLQDAA
jgi:hypothetical protein